MFATKIIPADCIYDKHTLYSKKFDDIYFSKENGEGESRHVFIDGNQLVQRWKSSSHKSHFSIGENGFGTGLNFLSTLNVWNNVPSHEKPAHLFFVSAELHPLKKEDLYPLGSLFPHLRQLLNILIKNYPPLIGGYHPLKLTKDITLLLMFGDVLEMWKEFYGNIDAWFLDGFSPDKSPHMWSSDVLKVIASHSIREETTYSTFSVARSVRDSLQQHGFSVYKKEGFGRKKEILVGTFISSTDQKNQHPLAHLLDSCSWENPTIGIIGAGLAGLWTASTLNQKGLNVHIWEKNAEVATKASGNKVGILSPYFSKVSTPHASFLMMSFLYTRNRLLQENGLIHCENGMIQFPKNKTQAERLHTIYESGIYPKELMCRKDPDSFSSQTYFYYSMGGYIYPKKIALHLEKEYNLSIEKNTEISTISPSSDGWTVHTKEQKHDIDILIIAGGNDIPSFENYIIQETKSLSGVVFSMHLPYEHAINCPIQFGKYVSPNHDDQSIHFGGVPSDDRSADEEIRYWMQELSEHLSLFQPPFSMQEHIVEKRTCSRMNSHDHFPTLGFLPIHHQWEQLYTEKHHKVDPSIYPNSKNQLVYKHLFLNGCHGSRGVSTTPLVAEIIASIILKEPLPVPLSVLDALQPFRFWLRKLRKKPFNR